MIATSNYILVKKVINSLQDQSSKGTSLAVHLDLTRINWSEWDGEGHFSFLLIICIFENTNILSELR